MLTRCAPKRIHIGLGLLGGQHVLAELGEPLLGFFLREALARGAEEFVGLLGGQAAQGCGIYTHFLG